MTQETEKPKCNIDDILCQMQALSHLKGLQSTLGDERFKSYYPELEGLSEKITERIKEQDTSLKEALEQCGLSTIKTEVETAIEEEQHAISTE